MISTEPLSSSVAAELDGQPWTTPPLEPPILSIVGVEPLVSPPVIDKAASPLEQQDFL